MACCTRKSRGDPRRFRYEHSLFRDRLARKPIPMRRTGADWTYSGSDLPGIDGGVGGEIGGEAGLFPGASCGNAGGLFGFPPGGEHLQAVECGITRPE